MTSQIVALIYIYFLSSATFLYLNFASNSFTFKKDYYIWVFSWLCVVTLAFLTHDFMLFSFVTALLLLVTSNIVKNKLALYCVLMIAIPPFAAKVSVFFSTSLTRELALLILLPIFIGSGKASFYAERPNLPKFGKLAVDHFIVLFLILKSALYYRGLSQRIDPLTTTEFIRQSIYVFLEFFLPYYVASRYIKDFEALKKVLFALMVAGMVAGCIAIFELGRSWLLYGELHKFLQISDWGQSIYIGRSNAIRATSSLEHPLVLGFIMLITIGIYLFISRFYTSKLLFLGGLLILVGGIVAPLSRGPWMGAFLMLTIFFGMGHNKGKNFTYFILAIIGIIIVLSQTSYSEKIIDLIPFLGKEDKFNVDYRSQLIEQSWLVIQQYPLFGLFDPTLEPEMQKLIQGQGIIDLVNYYLELTLINGIVGFILFFSACMTLLFKLFIHLKSFTDKASYEYICGKSLFATFVGVLLSISTTSGLSLINTTLYLFFGIIVSYMRVTKNEEAIEHKKLYEYPTTRVVKTNV
jgi:hypothetical protein